MNPTIATDALGQTPRLLAAAAAPVVDALEAVTPDDLTASVSDAAASVAEATVDGARSAAEPVCRNPRRLLAVGIVAALGLLVVWRFRRSRTVEPERLEVEQAA